MSVKIKQGQSPLEQKAIEARLDALEITTDPSTREVAESDAKRSKVKGGLAGLEKVAPTGQLGIEELDKVEKKFGLGQVTGAIASAVGRSEADKAHDAIKSAVLAISGTGEQLAAFVQKSKYDPSSVLSMFRALSELPNTLKGVTSNEVLAHASRAEINQLRTAYAGFLQTFFQHQSQMIDTINDTLLPWINQRVDSYNDMSKQVARGSDLLTYNYVMGDVDQKLRPDQTKQMVHQVSNYGESTKAVLAMQGLFS
jgi:hypothetical protein